MVEDIYKYEHTPTETDIGDCIDSMGKVGIIRHERPKRKKNNRGKFYIRKSETFPQEKEEELRQELTRRLKPIYASDESLEKRKKDKEERNAALHEQKREEIKVRNKQIRNLIDLWSEQLPEPNYDLDNGSFTSLIIDEDRILKYKPPKIWHNGLSYSRGEFFNYEKPRKHKGGATSVYKEDFSIKNVVYWGQTLKFEEDPRYEKYAGIYLTDIRKEYDELKRMARESFEKGHNIDDIISGKEKVTLEDMVEGWSFRIEKQRVNKEKKTVFVMLFSTKFEDKLNQIKNMLNDAKYQEIFTNESENDIQQ